MVVNPFKPKPVLTPADELLQTSATPPTIPQMLADSRARYGHKVVCQEKEGHRWRTLTFEETWRQAHDFAAGLIALGLQQGDRVALICENGLAWVVAYYGIALAGAVGVPLYTELKSAEAEELVRRAGARLVIASSRVLDRLDAQFSSAARVIVVGGREAREAQRSRLLRRARPGLLPFDQVPAQATPESRQALDQRHIDPDDLASIVFTSGTTGGMKGVMLTHRNFMSNVESARRHLQVDERDKLVLVLPMHHAFPFLIFLAAFAFGGELTFENDLLRVRDRLEEVKPTVFLGVPALYDLMYRAIVQRLEAEGRLEMFERGLRVVDVAKRRTGVNLGRLVFRELHQRLGGNLRFMVSGGSALNPDTALKYFRLGLPLLQGWGLTEAAPVLAAQRWDPRKFFFSNYYEDHVGTVGDPVAGVEVRLIDVPEKGIYANLHGQGELVARGPNIFPGYWQAPEETRAVKVDEWFRTGDLGRIDEEGNIWITGRSKYVIVLDSGEKVVPDELEERLGGSALIEDICVVERRQRDKVQVGAIVFPHLEAVTKQLGDSLSESDVREAVQNELSAFSKELAPYKRVSEVILTDTPLPKTALRKVARGQLPESYSFDLKRWRRNAEGLAAGSPAPGPDGDHPDEVAP